MMLTITCPGCKETHANQPDSLDALQCPCGLIYEVSKGTWCHPGELVADNRISRQKIEQQIGQVAGLMSASLGFWDWAVVKGGLPPETFQTVAWKRWESNLMAFMSEPHKTWILTLEIDPTRIIDLVGFKTWVTNSIKWVGNPPACQAFSAAKNLIGWQMLSNGEAQERGKELWARAWKLLIHLPGQDDGLKVRVEHLVSRVTWEYLSRKGIFTIEDKTC